MLKFFRIPFASSGDKTAVPDAVDVSGFVSYASGYGFDYQRQKTDPAAKNIERDKMNEIFFDLSNATAELQAQGIPDFITSALNGGTAYSYGANAVVRYSGDLYLSLVGTNTALPSDATKWALLPTPARIQSLAYTSAVAGGTADAITAAFVPAIAALPAAPGTLAVRVRAGAPNATTTPTFAADATAAKTIVKGNNLALAVGDIPGAGAWLDFAYDATLDKWVLQNPATGVATVSKGASIQGAFKNLDVSATGATATVSVLADEIAVEDASNNYQTLRAVALTLAGTAVGANGLDVGTIAANTWYSLWVIWNGTTTAGLMSLSATAPTLPSGYTHKARVGWMRTDSTANAYPRGFRQFGRRVQSYVAPGGNVTTLPVLATGTIGAYPAYAAVALANFVPITASAIDISTMSTTNNVYGVAPNNNYGSPDNYTNPPPIAVNSAGGQRSMMLLETMNLYATSSASCQIMCAGWEDTI